MAHEAIQPVRPSDAPPGPLAILAATAVGGLIGSRLKPAPLVLAAGATAFALLRQKRPPMPAAPASSHLPAPAPVPEAEAPHVVPQDQVRQWLSRQLDREKQAALLTPDPAWTPPPEPADDYQPLSLLIDEIGDSSAHSPQHSHFATLTEPVHHPATSVPPASASKESDFSHPLALDALKNAPHMDSAWLLGIEPLPSWSESGPAAEFFQPPSPSFAVEPAKPTFTSPLFAGAALPDEIEMIPPQAEPEAHHTSDTFPLPEPAPAPPEASFTPASPPNTAAPDPSIPEIDVQAAQPGEASFDTAPLPENPWQPVQDSAPETTLKPSATTSRPHIAVIDAEIFLRPRAPTQQNTSVVAKSPTSPRFSKNAPADEPPISPPLPEEPVLPSTAPALPRAPIQSPREQRARPTWRSWWRGD